MLMVLVLQSIHIYRHAFHKSIEPKHFCKSIVSYDLALSQHHDCLVCDFAFGFFTAPTPFYFEVLPPKTPTLQAAVVYLAPSFHYSSFNFRRGPPQL
jgi:hypothetical protein